MSGDDPQADNSKMKTSPGKMLTRCEWARNDLAIRYHDREWGVPQHDDRVLFEFLVLEGAQAGLSWDTILRNVRTIAQSSTASIRRKSRVITNGRFNY